MLTNEMYSDIQVLKKQIAELHGAILSTSLNPYAIYDNSDLKMMLKVSSRTLQTWRDQRLINYSQIGSKIYYRGKDVQEFIDQNKVEDTPTLTHQFKRAIENK